MEAGIVGMPDVGKSTLFNALTAAGALAANYPFATIEPNVGVVPIPDDRLKTINKYIETIETELILADLQTVEGALPKAERAAKSQEQEHVVRYAVLKKFFPVLAAGKPARTVKLDDPLEIKAAKSLGFISAKKVLF